MPCQVIMEIFLRRHLILILVYYLVKKLKKLSNNIEQIQEKFMVNLQQRMEILIKGEQQLRVAQLYGEIGLSERIIAFIMKNSMLLIYQNLKNIGVRDSHFIVIQGLHKD